MSQLAVLQKPKEPERARAQRKLETTVPYEKPKLEKQSEMVFPKEIWELFNKGSRFCMQCSSCHGCS